MKKLLLLTVLVLSSITASAQIWVGGNLGFGIYTSKWQGEPSSTGASVFIAPEIGYNITNNIAVAAEISVDYGKDKFYNTNGTTFLVGPYVRYTFTNNSRFNFFGEFAMHYINRKYGEGMGGLNMQLRPGMSVNLTKNFDLIGKFNLLEFNHFSKKGVGYNEFGFAITGLLSIGFAYTF